MLLYPSPLLFLFAAFSLSLFLSFFSLSSPLSAFLHVSSDCASLLQEFHETLSVSESMSQKYFKKHICNQNAVNYFSQCMVSSYFPSFPSYIFSCVCVILPATFVSVCAVVDSSYRVSNHLWMSTTHRKPATVLFLRRNESTHIDVHNEVDSH